MAGRVLPMVGKLNYLLYRVPGIGDRVVRGQSRLAAKLAFHAPLLGGRRSTTLEGVKSEWLKFLAMAGIQPDITREGEREFEFQVQACPYGFHRPEEKGVCDACMDLDRAYVKLLGGELEVLESIPAGSPRCRIAVRVA
ncbi:MAG: hypothetical protein AB1640_02020 [bacterium]